VEGWWQSRYSEGWSGYLSSAGGQLELAGQRAQRGQGIGVEDLGGHVVRARVQVRSHTAGDRRRVAVTREPSDQRVAAAAREVGVGPAQPAQVAEVVGQAEIRVLHLRAADGTGPLRVGLQDQLLLRGEQRSVAKDLPGLTRVLRRDQVGVRARGPLR